MDFNSSVQNIAWFKDRYLEGTLKIKPPYQRKPIWSAKQKCYLIESILFGLPVPEIYIQQTVSPDAKTEYAVVDGQQRIRTILQFIGAETDRDEQEHNKFILDKLALGSKWKDTSFHELSDYIKSQYYSYTLSVRYLNTNDDEQIRDMFQRLNRFLTPLKPQELRNATYLGPFIKLSENLANDEYWAENRIVTAAAIRRMADIEFISELLIGVMHGPQGGSSKVIDEYYKQYEDYDDEFPDQPRTARLFKNTLEIIVNSIPNIKETRWRNKTDFYTLFIAIAHLLRNHQFINSKIKLFRKSLINFASEIDKRLNDGEANVSKHAVEYVRAVEKGANDKKRRADRHNAILFIIRSYFKSRA